MRLIARTGALDHLGGGAHERFQARGGGVVVGVGLVPLDHRELGVVLGRDALVAEVLAELVDAFQTTDDAALEVELGGDPQVEGAVQRIVVGGEGPRQGAAVDRLQDWGLDLEETLAVEIGADRGDDASAVAKAPADLNA